MNNIKKYILILLLIIAIALTIIFLTIGIRPQSKYNAGEKAIYLEQDSLSKKVSLCISDNDKPHSSKVRLVTWKEGNNWFQFSMYYALGGVHLRKNLLYYCDVDRKKIVAYDLKTGKKEDLVSNVLYPFCVSEDGEQFVCSTKMENQATRHFKWTQIGSGQEREFPIELGGFNSFIRPLKIINNKYILYDASMYETECRRGYFIYDPDRKAMFLPEVLNDAGEDINSMDLIAFNGPEVAFMNGKGKDVCFVIRSINTLYAVDLNTRKVRELYHNGDIDIQAIRYVDQGRTIEMLGRIAIGKGVDEAVPYKMKDVTVKYDMKTGKARIFDRKEPVPELEFPVNTRNEIGIYKP